MALKNKIIIGIDNEQIELSGQELELFLEQRKKDQEEANLIEKEIQDKKDARQNAINKLAQIAGLTDEEIAAII